LGSPPFSAPSSVKPRATVAVWLKSLRWRSDPVKARGLPGSSADLSTRAAPSHPGRSGECLPVAPPRYQASSESADWPPSFSYRGRIGFTCVAAHVFASQVLASPIAGTHLGRLHVRTGYLPGELLSFHKITEAYPWHTDHRER
jgi:hypothetical protein